MIKENMSLEDISKLNDTYFNKDEYVRPGDFEHRVDPDSSAVMYSMIRDYKPKTLLAIGTWNGGSTCLMMNAMQKNGGDFTYVASELLDDKRASTEANCKQKNGKAPVMIGDITKNLDKVPHEIDCLFHDTDHDMDTTEWVYKNIFPRLKKGALVMMHDWAVEEKDGKWLGKGENGIGGWPETEFWLQKHRDGKFPLNRVFWNYQNPGQWELGVFLNK